MKSKSAYCVCAVLLMQYTLTAQVILSATKAEFILGVTDDVKNANIHGVYPVKLKWNDAGKKYDVYRAGLETGEFTLISKDVSGGEYTDINGNAKPEQFFYYKIKSGAEESNEDEGYGALTQDVYMNVYNKNIVSSHSKLSLMFKRLALQKLGKEFAQGSFSGSLSYRARAKGSYKVEPAGFPSADVGWDMLLPEDTGVTDRELEETDGSTNADF